LMVMIFLELKDGDTLWGLKIKIKEIE
jgi:hypothetical protein